MQITNILDNFDIAIINTPKEGIMGLDRNSEPLILHNGDMVSMNLLDKKFAELLFTRGMLTPIKTREKPRQKMKVMSVRVGRKGRAKKNHRLDKWFKW